MVLCGRCNEDVSDAIQCSVCAKHYGFPCSGITETGYRKLGERQATWRCPACKTAGLHLGTGQKIPSGSPIQSPTPVTLEQKTQLAPLSSVVSDVKEIKSDLSDLKASVNDSARRISKLEEKLHEIENVHEDVTSLKTKESSLEEELNRKEQWLRMNNVEIKGVPMKTGENLFEVVAQIGTKIMYPIAKSTINYVTRVPTKGDGLKPVILFVNRYVKEDFVAAARSLKTLKPIDINLEGTGHIYVNDHLTVQNKILLSKAKDLAKEYNFQHTWVKHAKVLVKKDIGAPVIHINTEKDLQKIH